MAAGRFVLARCRGLRGGVGSGGCRQQSPAVEIAALREAVDHYIGDLLEGSYDERLFSARERLHHRHLAALHRLTVLLTERGEHTDAMRFAQELLRYDPLCEETYRAALGRSVEFVDVPDEAATGAPWSGQAFPLDSRQPRDAVRTPASGRTR